MPAGDNPAVRVVLHTGCQQLPGDESNIVVACNFFNTADNHYFQKAGEYKSKFDGLTREELVAQRKPFVLKTREEYYKFWKDSVV